MTQPGQIDQPEMATDGAAALRSPGDARSRLALLYARLASPQPDRALEKLLGNVSDAVDSLTIEHTGMAEELLCVYEQLGIVFEMTRKLPGVQGESEVLDLCVDSLRRSFAKRDVHVVHPCMLTDDSNTLARSNTLACPNRSDPAWCREWMRALVRRARDGGGVLVESPPSGLSIDDLGLSIDGDSHLQSPIPNRQSKIATEVMVGPVRAGETFVCAIVLTGTSEVEAFRASDMLLLESLTMFCGDLIANYRLVQELRETSVNMVRALVNAVDQKDSYTSGHSVRVGYYATLLGQSLGFEENDQEMLRWSALLHDVGKIGIRDDVLNKTGKLSPDEWNHMKEHPVRSHEVLQEVPQLTKALDGVLHHHEHFDGSGYPEGLAGEEIPLQARIIQIADIFDALTSNRSYRREHSWQRALEILDEEAGSTIDPELHPVFDRLIREAVDGQEDGWARMVERANQFGQTDSPKPQKRSGFAGWTS